MLKETDLQQVKCMAKTLLYTDINIDEQLPIFCHHPFFQTTAFFDPKTKEALDLTNEDHLDKAREIMTDIIFDTKDYSHFAMLIQKPYLPAFFKYTEEFLNAKDYAKFLQHLWVTTEFPNHDANVSLAEFKKYFRKADKELLMGDDYKKYQELPDKITVYRGVYQKATTKALSWTIDKKKAEWFAGRFGNGGKVYEATIDKKDIFAYFPSAGESEVVLNNNKLENLKEIEQINKDNIEEER